MKKVSSVLKYIPILLASVLFMLSLYITEKVYNASFDQLLFSLLKTEGTSFNALSDGFFYVLVGTLLIFPFLVLPIIRFKKKVIVDIKIGKKRCRKQLFPIRNVKVYNTSMIILSLFVLFYSSGFFDYIYYNFNKSSLFEDYYVDTKDVDVVFPEKKQNLIYIFLESMESSNFSKENGGVFKSSIIPNLEKLAIENINFSNTSLLGGALESYGNSWTMAAMVAQTAGIPLKVVPKDVFKNSTNLEKVTNIGDVLKENGYDNYLMLGSDVNFGGRKQYFEFHNYEISDYYTAIEEGIIDNDYFEWWGFEDAKLFSYAKEKLEEISKSDRPFNLTLLTADTHFTDGYLDKSCEKRFDISYANAFYCSDSMIYEFIEWVKNQDFYENTTIILSGDHLTMQDNIYDGADTNFVRTVYNVFINPKADFVENKNRIFTTFDMYPSTLAALGVKIEGDRLGLGTNLFSSKKTIPEEIGLNIFNDELKKRSTYYSEKVR